MQFILEYHTNINLLTLKWNPYFKKRANYFILAKTSCLEKNSTEMLIRNESQALLFSPEVLKKKIA